MVFEGVANQFVELKIVDYEFPKSTGGDWDRNWLIIFLNVKSVRDHWQALHASLTTWEVSMLINWFEKLSDSLMVDSVNMSFTEPNLSFTLLNAIDAEFKMIRIKFDLESKPQISNDDYFVDICANNNDLKEIAIGLHGELVKFPERVATSKNEMLQKVMVWGKKIISHLK